MNSAQLGLACPVWCYIAVSKRLFFGFQELVPPLFAIAPGFESNHNHIPKGNLLGHVVALRVYHARPTSAAQAASYMSDDVIGLPTLAFRRLAPKALPILSTVNTTINHQTQ